jgi:aldose 1-epimerase
MSSQVFGNFEGKPVTLYTLKNKQGMTCKVMDYGATLVSLKAPDRIGRMGEVTLGFENFDDYLTKSPYFGCAVGRVGNRIRGGKFDLDGKTYQLALNDGPNSLHGGKIGFDKKIWTVAAVTANSILFNLTSPDGDEGYPGELKITLRYTLGHDQTLRMEYAVTAKQRTIQNLTNHTYFNLGDENILKHRIRVLSDAITPVDETLIPTGELMPVEGTPFDLRQLTTIGKGIDEDHIQLQRGLGYDHNWVLSRRAGRLRRAAELHEPKSGRFMEVFTTEPGIQFYSGNFIAGPLVGHGGKNYEKRGGLCLETQHYPDSVNQSKFPSVVLDAGKTYRSTTIYKFKAK